MFSAIFLTVQLSVFICVCKHVSYTTAFVGPTHQSSPSLFSRSPAPKTTEGRKNRSGVITFSSGCHILPLVAMEVVCCFWQNNPLGVFFFSGERSFFSFSLPLISSETPNDEALSHSCWLNCQVFGKLLQLPRHCESEDSTKATLHSCRRSSRLCFLPRSVRLSFVPLKMIASNCLIPSALESD